MKILKPARTRPKKGEEPDWESYTHKICNRCGQILPIEEFSKSKAKTRRGWAYRSYCRSCNKKICSIYDKNNRERRNTYLRNWRKQNPEVARKNDRKGRLRWKYGLSIEDYERLSKEQENKCAICQKMKLLVVDHDHKTGEVRGLLCRSCNHLLGLIEMYPQNLGKYLDQKCHVDVIMEMLYGDQNLHNNV